MVVLFVCLLDFIITILNVRFSKCLEKTYLTLLFGTNWLITTYVCGKYFYYGSFKSNLNNEASKEMQFVAITRDTTMPERPSTFVPQTQGMVFGGKGFFRQTRRTMGVSRASEVLNRFSLNNSNDNMTLAKSRRTLID